MAKCVDNTWCKGNLRSLKRRKGRQKMGLAASQARLLTITHRIISDEHDLMKLSTQKFRLRAEGEELSSQYDYMKNVGPTSGSALAFGDNFGFTYDDLMGKSALNNGADPVIITSATNNRVILDSKYQAAISAVLKVTGQKGIENKIDPYNTQAFNAFVTALTGKSLDWATVKNGNVAPAERYASIPQYTSLVNQIKADCASYEPSVVEPREREDYINSFVNEKNFFSKAFSTTIKKHANQLFDESLPNLRKEWATTYSNMLHAKARQMDSTQPLKSQNVLINSNVLIALIDGKSPDLAYVDTLVNPSATQSATADFNENKKIADFYFKVFSAICKNGCTYDEKITDSDYLNAQLTNNKFKVNNKIASENNNFNFVKRESYQADVRDWYEREKEKISYQEEDIELKSTRIQTELTALNTEKQSVQSIIDKNIERSFTYLTTG